MNILTDEEISEVYEAMTSDVAGSCLLIARAIEAAVMSKLAEQYMEPVSYEFQSENGEWCSFMNQRHYENTVADGSWPIRKLFDESQLIAAQQRTAEACAKVCEGERSDDGDGQHPAWYAGFDACAEAIRTGDWREYL